MKSIDNELKILRKRWKYIKTDTIGARALLLLLQNEKGTPDDFDVMVDRIIESRFMSGMSESLKKN